MRRILPLLMLAIALLMGADDAAAARIGVASVVKNEVNGSSGGAHVIKVGTGIFQNEVITTGTDSSAQLLFRDETSLTIGANARLTMDKFVYDPNSRSGAVVVNVLQGTFRFVSGSVKPGGYTIKTPVATVGLRGTVVEGFVNTDGSLLLVIVEGSVIVSTASVATVTLNAGQYITVSASGVVTGPRPWTGRTLDIESGHEFILDTQNPQEDHRDQLNDALDSRGLDITYPPSPDDSGGGQIGGPTSDIRLKRDIHHLATLENGIKIHAFKYLWEDRVHVGVMAQDLLRHPVRKQAVFVMPNGYYGVDYSKLGLTMTTLAEWKRHGVASVMPGLRIAPVKARHSLVD